MWFFNVFQHDLSSLSLSAVSPVNSTGDGWTSAAFLPTRLVMSQSWTISGGASPNSAVQTRNGLVHAYICVLVSVESGDSIDSILSSESWYMKGGCSWCADRLRRCFPKHRCSVPWPCHACGCALDMWLGPMICFHRWAARPGSSMVCFWE